MQPHRNRRLGIAVLAAVGVALMSTALVAAKDGGIAKLAGLLPRDAEPGSTITVYWSLASGTDDQGHTSWFSVPSGAYVKLIGLDVSEAVGTETTPGHYVADIVVPNGGIKAVEFGIANVSTVNGVTTRSNMVFAFQGPILEPAIPPPAPRNEPAKAEPKAGSGGSPAQPAAPTMNPMLVIGSMWLALAALASLVALRRRAALA
jgi:hypothetical protein